MSRIIEFADGYESSTAPASGAVQATALKSFPNDAAYVADKGSAAAEGDTYWNSTDDQPKFYTGGAWVQGVTTAGAQTIAGNKTFSNDVVIGGDLTVQGTTTTLNTATLDVEDANITVNKGGNVASADASRAGIEVELSDAAEAGVGFDSSLATKFKVGEVGSQAEVVSTSHTQTLTNKTIDDDTNTIQNVAVTALKTVIGNALKFLSFDAAGAPISTKVVPTGAVVGTTDAQVLTLKDYDGGTASNTNRTTLAKETTTNLTSLTRKQGNVFYDTTKNKPVFDDGTNLNEMGGSGGSGSGRVNNLDSNDSNLETSIGNWTTFDDGASLVDGAGGSPTVITVARNTTTPLASTGDLKISHSAADGLGEGVVVPFTSRNADKSSVQEISFDYYTSSGYADDVMEIWIYDVTNAALIAVTPYKLKASLTPTKFKALFQNSATSTSYKLIAFCNSTSAVAFDIYADNLLVGPPIYNYGLVGTDWVSFTPTGTWVANTTYYGKYRRIGDSIEVMVRVSLSGAPTSTNLYIDLPPGKVIDSSKVNSTSQLQVVLGSASVLDDGVQLYSSSVLLQTTTKVELSGIWAGNAGRVNETNPITFGSGDEVNIIFTAPIVGYSSNVQMSDEADLRIVAASYYLSANFVTSSGTPVNYDTKIIDTHNAVTTSPTAWKFTAPVSGYYQIVLPAYDASSTVHDFAALYKNGSVSIGAVAKTNGATAGNGYGQGGGAIVQLNANDYIDIRGNTTIRGGTLTGGNTSRIDIIKVQGPSAIAANELILAKYTATSLTNAIPNTSAPTVFDCPTKQIDTHGAVTTGSSWLFTCPIAGKYRITSVITPDTNAWVTNNYLIMSVFKNNVNNSLLQWWTAQSSSSLQMSVGGSTIVDCVSGDTLQVLFECSRAAGSITGVEGVASKNQITIERIGF